MPVTPITIPGFPPQAAGFSHATASTGESIVHISGQVGTRDGHVVDGGLAAQTAQAMLNVRAAVEAAGAALSDIAHVRLYVVNWSPSLMEEFGAGAAAARAAGMVFPPSSVTLIGVAALFEPEMLIEIEAVAILD
jgi:enamine deaminase RidA (YjgF/YER057c/UK114 family)